MENRLLQLFIHPSLEEEAKLFLQEYNPFKLVLQSDARYSKRNLKGYTNRTCKFCGRGFPQVTFANDSHLLPQLIGNANLYSEFECDECNASISKLENDLANYLGISRSIVGLQGEKKTKGFDARRLKVKSRSFIGDNILIVAPEDIKTDGDTTSISYTKNPYVPSKAYKALLKSAVSLLDETELAENYQQAIACLDGKMKLNYAIIGGYRLSFTTNLPLHVLCFKRKSADNALPEHIISFYFQTHIISLPIPHDGPLDWAFAFPPPFFFDEKLIWSAMPEPVTRDMSLNIKVEDEEETIMFQIDPEAIKDLRCYDPKIDACSKERFNPANLKHLIITKIGVTVDPKELSDFIKKEMGENE